VRVDWSIVISIVACFFLIALIRNRWWAYAGMIGTNTYWIVTAIQDGDTGRLILFLAYDLLNVYGIIAWKYPATLRLRWAWICHIWHTRRWISFDRWLDERRADAMKVLQQMTTAFRESLEKWVQEYLFEPVVRFEVERKPEGGAQ
jgi:hypothetical protein